MTRITNVLREAIVAKAIDKAGLNDKRAEYDKRRAAWTEAVRIDGLGGPVKAAELEALDAQIRKQLEAYGDDLESIQAFGEQVVTQMCERLLDGGAPGLHFYTLNQAEPSLAIWNNLKLPR